MPAETRLVEVRPLSDGLSGAIVVGVRLAIGVARYQGEPVGKQGDAQIYSLSPTKLLITGEGPATPTPAEEK